MRLSEQALSILNIVCEIRLSVSEMLDEVSPAHIYSRGKFSESMDFDAFNLLLEELKGNGLIFFNTYLNGTHGEIKLTLDGFRTYISYNSISIENSVKKIIDELNKYKKNIEGRNDCYLRISKENFYYDKNPSEMNRYSDYIIQDLEEKGVIKCTRTMGQQGFYNLILLAQSDNYSFI